MTHEHASDSMLTALERVDARGGRPSRRRVAILTDVPPWPTSTGLQLRVAGLIDHLRRRHRVTLIVASPDPPAGKGRRRCIQAVDRFIYIDTVFRGWKHRCRGVLRAIGGRALENAAAGAFGAIRAVIAAGIAGVSSSQSAAPQRRSGAVPRRPHDARVGSRLARHLHNQDAVIVVNIRLRRMFHPDDHRGIVKLMDTLDVMHMRWESHAAHGIEIGPEYHLSREEEATELRGYDVVVAIHEDERRVFLDMLPGHPVICVPVALEAAPAPTRRDEVCFVGSAAPANVHAVARIVAEVWPRVVQLRPGARLNIAGSVCAHPAVIEAAATCRASITLHGVLDDLTTVYECAVVLAPVWIGSGLKLKVLEALARGKAVVTTTVGAQGMTAGAGQAFRVCDEPRAIASAVVELLDDAEARRRLERAAAEFVRHSFSEEHVFKELDDALQRRIS